MGGSAYKEAVLDTNPEVLSAALTEGLKQQTAGAKEEITDVLGAGNDPVNYYTNQFNELYELNGEYRTNLLLFKKHFCHSLEAGHLTDQKRQQAFAIMLLSLNYGWKEPGMGSEYNWITLSDPTKFAYLFLEGEEDCGEYKKLSGHNPASSPEKIVKQYGILCEILKKDKYRNLFGQKNIEAMQKRLDEMQKTL